MYFRVSRNFILLTSAFGITAALTFLQTELRPEPIGDAASGFLFWLFVALIMVLGSSQLRMTNNMKLLVLLGILSRTILTIVECYGTGPISVFLRTDDGFYPTAIERFYGNLNAYRTNYVYVLTSIFQFAGTARVIPAMLNVLIWFLGLIVIQAVTGTTIGKEKPTNYFLLLYIFLPFSMVLSVMVVRESIISLSLMISFSFVLKWMEKGRTSDGLLSLLTAGVAVWLHRGNVAMWLAITAIFIFWKPSIQKWRKINQKLILLPFCVPLAVFLFQKHFNGGLAILSVDEVLKRITSGRFNLEARANYIPWNMTYSGPLQFIGNTLYLMLYFWISPTPRFWSAGIDLVGAFCDTTPWIIFYYLYIKKMYKKGSDKRAIAGMIIMLVFTFVYGWGTRNAGTAMRHRDQLLGVMTMAAVVAAKKPIPQPEDRSLCMEES